MTTDICYAEVDEIILVFVNSYLEQTGYSYHSNSHKLLITINKYGWERGRLKAVL